MALGLAARLREARETSSLSQRALAKNTGISNATISLIESGRLNPSVAMLKRILDGIPMGLSAFFAAETNELTSPMVYAREDLVEIARGKISYREAGHHVAGRAIQILHERNEPGAATGKVALLHSGEEGIEEFSTDFVDRVSACDAPEWLSRE